MCVFAQSQQNKSIARNEPDFRPTNKFTVFLLDTLIFGLILSNMR